MSEKPNTSDDGPPKTRRSDVHRRRILLGGTMLTGASALGIAPLQLAQAQTPPASPRPRRAAGRPTSWSSGATT